jgi:hypothetical protein
MRFIFNSKEFPMPYQAIESFLFGMLVLVPLITGFWRRHQLDTSYHTLLHICVVACVAEILRFGQVALYVRASVYPSMVVYNLYVFVLGILFPLFFYWQGAVSKPLLQVIWLVFGAVWLADHIFFGVNRILSHTQVFRMVYSSVLCVLAVRQINRLIITSKISLLKHPSFLVCCGVLLFFMPYIIQESIKLFNPSISNDFFTAIFAIRKIMVIFVYLLYTLAFLWAPTKKTFISL